MSQCLYIERQYYFFTFKPLYFQGAPKDQSVIQLP